MKPLLSTLLAVLLLSQAYAQDQYGIRSTDTLPENFKLSTTFLREHIYKGIPERIKKELYPRDAFRFADQSAVSLSSLFAQGRVYSDWPAMENYLNRVMQKIMPPELKNDAVIHAYAIKDGSFNAFMTPFGIFMVHVGLLEALETEAALAGVMAHELAHYYMQHSLNTYVRGERGEFTRVFGRRDASGFSVQNELQADSLAILWMTRSGFGAKGMKDAFAVMKRMENKTLMMFENKWELKETTHPLGERRLAQVDSLAANQGGVDYLVDEKAFKELREVAVSESLKRLLYDFSFDDCIEKAFKHHILHPEKAEYVYFLMEAIRRKCYLNTDMWKRKFISDRYYIEEKSKNNRRKVKMPDHIFKTIPTELLMLSAADMQQIQAKFYWEELKFETYEEAFNFFSQIGELYEEPECILSNALSFSSDSIARSALLTKYLKYDQARHKALAISLLNGNPQQFLPPRKLTVLSDVYATIRQGNDEIFIRTERLSDDNHLSPYLETAVKAYPERKVLNLSALQNQKINDYLLFQELKILATTPIYAKGEQTMLHYIDPRYWELMLRYKVDEIEFIDISYYDARKSESSIEAYKEVIQTPLETYLSETKRNRYIATRILALREVPNSLMKVSFYGAEEKFDYNTPARDQLSEYLQKNLADKDKEVKKLEKLYLPGKK